MVSPEKIQRQFKHFYLIIATLLGLWCCFFIVRTLPRLSYSFALDPCEPFSLNRSLSLAQHKSIYKDVNQYPFFLANYPPLYEWAISFFVQPARPSYFAGRLVSYLAQLGVLLLCGLIIYRQTGQKIASWIGGLSLSLTCSAWMWSGFHRVDMLGLFWNTLGIWLFLRLPLPKKYYAIPAFLLAGYTKQMFVSAPIAGFVWLYKQKPRLAWRFFFLYTVAGIAIYGLACWLTNGNFFYHTLYYNFTPLSLNRAVDMACRPLGKAFGLWIIIGWILIVRRKKGEFVWDFLHIYGVLVYLVLVFTAGKIGSSWNYFLELGVVMGLLLGLSLARLIEVNSSKGLYFVALFFLLQFGYSIPTLVKKDHRLWKKALYWKPYKEKLLRVCRATPGKILVEHTLQKTKMAAVDGVVLSGKTIALNIHYYLMMQGHLWDPAPLEKQVRDGRFSLIILNQKVPSGPIHNSRLPLICQYYRFDRQIGPLFLFVPK